MDIDMEPDTTDPSYWLNWRFLICAIWILAAMVFAAILIWRYERPNKSKKQPSGNKHEADEFLYMNEAWGTCSTLIHPNWLLAYRVISFIIMLGFLIADAVLYPARIVYFYTQWTFILVTIYFGLASSLSIYGCLFFRGEEDHEEDVNNSIDPKRGIYVAPTADGETDFPSLTHCRHKSCRAASIWRHALQIIFQICAGAVALTDFVFWLIIYPMSTAINYKISFLVVCMHSVNSLLVGDAILNCLRFPFFRIAYFILWTNAFVIFQWTVHACVSIRWPYAFLDLSNPYAPLWYLAMGILHLLCFGIFALIFWIKRWFQSI